MTKSAVAFVNATALFVIIMQARMADADLRPFCCLCSDYDFYYYFN